MTNKNVLESVVNVSEGRNDSVLAELRRAAGPCLLDLHRDADHHRSVFSLGGPPSDVEAAVRSLAASTLHNVDLRSQRGVHPRIGALDVVPFISLVKEDPGSDLVEGNPAVAFQARDRFARWAAETLELPCFFYGADRSLPEIRRRAWTDLQPDSGPPQPHPTAGACATGARGLLVAYNLWLDGSTLAGCDLEVARRVAAEIRSPKLRTLGLAVGSGAQVSCNLVAPGQVGPADAFDAVASRVPIARAELVGLLPRAVLTATPPHRWPELDLDVSETIGARLEETGLDGGRFTAVR